MGELVKRTIDWIDTAPIRIEGKAESSASPDAVFAVLADHERWPEWFPSVREVIVLGPASGVGAIMATIAPRLTAGEIEDVAAYFASLDVGSPAQAAGQGASP